MRILVRSVVLWAVIVALGVAGWEGYKYVEHKASSKDFATNQAAPDFLVRDQQGRPFQLSSLRGDKVLLVFYRGHH